MAMKNVKVIDADTIEHKGKRYVKVGADVEAQKGDVIKRKDGDSNWFTKDAFYKVKKVYYEGYVRVKDDESKKVKVIRKKSELFRNVAKETPIIAEVDDVVSFEGFDGEYRKVERYAQDGDIVVFHKTGGNVFKTGNPYKVISGVQLISNYGDMYDVYREKMGRTAETVDVYEKVEAYESELADVSEPKLKVGDFVKFNENQCGIIGGDLYEIIERSRIIGFIDKDGDFRYSVVFSDAHKILTAGEAKWAAIGRKVNEAKVGDIIRVTNDVCAKPVGTIFKVASVYMGISHINDENGKSYTLGTNVELVAPVEATFK